MHNRIVAIATLVILGQTVAPSFAEDLAPFATVDGTEITRQQFERSAYTEARQTFYHGQPTSEAEYLEFRRGVATELVEKVLLLKEAKRRGIGPDDQSIAAQLAVYEDRYGETERWQAEGDQMLAKLRQQFEEDSILSILEEQLTVVAAPSEAVLQSYYDENRDKFTQPEQIRVSVILLAVSPSSTGDAWEAARLEAADITRRIRDGASFAELARMHSADPSGKNGGDMGFLHAGMLSDAAQKALDELEVNDLSEPVTVLEGIAVFRLADRQEATLQPFAAVRQRAEDLWRRDAGERMWDQTISRLRSESSITIDEEYLRSLPATRM